MPIFTGNSSQEAIEKGLTSLNLSTNDVQITILEEGKKGIFGIGKKMARVEITPKEIPVEVPVETKSQTIVERVEVVETVDNNSNFEEQLSTEYTETDALEELRDYLEMVASQLVDNAVTVTIQKQRDVIKFQIDTDKQGLLIGKHGKTLNALQYLAQVFLHRKWKNKRSIVVNVGDYREKRQEILERLAEKTAQKVMTTKRPIFLEPMPAFERKQIHAVLSKHEAVQTHSEGDEPYRYLVIEPRR